MQKYGDYASDYCAAGYAEDEGDHNAGITSFIDTWWSAIKSTSVF